jgi:hypothetical protein
MKTRGGAEKTKQKKMDRQVEDKDEKPEKEIVKEKQEQIDKRGKNKTYWRNWTNLKGKI